jgi:hypothetical protein
MNAATVRRQDHGGGDAPSTPEYDAFGPWVDPVRTAEEVPPLYRDHPVDLAGSRLVLKVPRDIARRDATPDRACATKDEAVRLTTLKDCRCIFGVLVVWMRGT